MILFVNPLEVRFWEHRKLFVAVESPTEDLGVFENGVQLEISPVSDEWGGAMFELALDPESHEYEVRYRSGKELFRVPLKLSYRAEDEGGYSRHTLEYQGRIWVIEPSLRVSEA